MDSGGETRTGCSSDGRSIAGSLADYCSDCFPEYTELFQSKRSSCTVDERQRTKGRKGWAFMSLDFGIWVEGLVTIAMLSYVWKENPFYRIAEHLYVGISAGHAVVMAWGNIRDATVNAGRRPAVDYSYPARCAAVPRYFKGISWIARYPVAVMVGMEPELL